MTKKLEEEFNLPPMDEANSDEPNKIIGDTEDKLPDLNDISEFDVTAVDIEDVQTALTNAEKIKLVEICLRYVMPKNVADTNPLPDDIQIRIIN